MDVFTVLFFLFLLGIFLTSWKSYFFPSGSLHVHRIEAMVCCATMIVCAGGIGLVLWCWSSNEVRGDSGDPAGGVLTTAGRPFCRTILPRGFCWSEEYVESF